MKIKVLAVLCLAAIAGLAGCRSATNTNTANTNAVVVTSPTPTAVPKTNEAPVSTDPNMKSKVEAALKAKGFNDVTVDMTTTPATLRGTVAKGKLAEVNQVAQEAAGKPFTNQVTEK